MALAPSWDTVAAPGLRARDLTLPQHRPRVPRYPAGRHRGARTSWLRAMVVALVSAPSYTGRHRPGRRTMGYAGRHRG